MVQFDHEKSDVYASALDYAVWAFGLAQRLPGEHRQALGQWLHESQAVPRSIAESIGRTALADRQRCLEDAQAFAYGCAALQDVLHHCGAISEPEHQEGKERLHVLLGALAKMTEGGSRSGRKTDARSGRLALSRPAQQDEGDTVFMPAPDTPRRRSSIS
jgi:hypothetical protein